MENLGRGNMMQSAKNKRDRMQIIICGRLRALRSSFKIISEFIRIIPCFQIYMGKKIIQLPSILTVTCDYRNNFLLTCFTFMINLLLTHNV